MVDNRVEKLNEERQRRIWIHWKHILKSVSDFEVNSSV